MERAPHAVLDSVDLGPPGEPPGIDEVRDGGGCLGVQQQAGGTLCTGEGRAFGDLDVLVEQAHQPGGQSGKGGGPALVI